MKWVLAGLSFAFLVAVAVGTVALKAANVRTTRRLEMTSLTNPQVNRRDAISCSQ